MSSAAGRAGSGWHRDPEVVSMETNPSVLISEASRGRQPCPEPGLWTSIVPVISCVCPGEAQMRCGLMAER